MTRQRRVRLDCEEYLEYPLSDLDGRAYTGPDEMGVSLPPDLNRRLRDLQSRWQKWQDHGGHLVPADEGEAWIEDFDAV